MIPTQACDISWFWNVLALSYVVFFVKLDIDLEQFSAECIHGHGMRLLQVERIPGGWCVYPKLIGSTMQAPGSLHHSEPTSRGRTMHA